jgi:hypothetical protein
MRLTEIFRRAAAMVLSASRGGFHTLFMCWLGHALRSRELTDVNGRSFTTRLAAPSAGAEATQ